jgi:protocatechuate 3,4-dioxygenase beta subunit
MVVPLVLAAFALTAQTLPPAGPPRDALDTDLKSGTAVVSGRVTDAETGEPMARVTVSLNRLGTRDQLDTKTGTNGTFQFSRVPAGAYAVTADPIGSTTHRSAGYGVIAGKPPGKHSTIELRDGEVFDRADIALTRTFVISARVVDEDGAPIADMLVTADAFDGRAGGRRSRTTDDRGAVRLWGYSVGTYKVCAVPNSGPNRQEAEGFVRTCHHAATSDSEAQPLTVANGDPPEVEIRMRRTRLFRISGVVIDASGQIAPAASVSLVIPERSGTSGHNIQNNGGNFSVGGIAPGEYVITAEVPYRSDPDDRTRPVGYALVNVQSADVENLVVAMSEPPTVRGRLVFEGGAPPDPRSINIRARPARGTVAMAMGRSDATSPVKADLSFELAGVVGPNTLQVTAPGEWVVKSVRYGGQERINIPTEFKSHVDPSALQVVLTNRPAKLVARVLDEKGQPIEDARVLLFPADPRQWDGGGATSVWRFGTQREGTYEFAGLRPAEYLLAVLPDGLFFQDDDHRPLEELSKHAERITLLENDQRTVDIAVRR